MLTGACERVRRYKEQGEDLWIPALLPATNDIQTRHEFLLEFCRQIHNGQLPPKAALDTALDGLLEIVLASKAIVDEMYD